jgi:vacuolar-type H+-ATPase subunit E/Vma4
MGTSELVQKILADGKAREANIAAERDRTIAEADSRAAAEGAAIEAERAERTRREATAILEQARGRARLQHRNAVLAARWQVLERVVQRAQDKVRADRGYPAFITGIVKKYARPDSVVSLSEPDSRSFGAGMGVPLGDPAPIAGGAMIRTGKEELNFSLYEALSGLRDGLAHDLSRVLFGD